MEYWKKLNLDGTISTVESCSYSHEMPDAIQIAKEEYDTFIASLPVVVIKPEPVRDLAVEIDQIKAEIVAIKARVGIK